MEDIFSIGEVSKLLDVPAATIRFWEQEGLLSPRKEANRYRAYGPRELAEIADVVFLRSTGVPVKRILQMRSFDLEQYQDGLNQLEDYMRSHLETCQRICGQIQRQMANTHEILRLQQEPYRSEEVPFEKIARFAFHEREKLLRYSGDPTLYVRYFDTRDMSGTETRCIVMPPDASGAVRGRHVPDLSDPGAGGPGLPQRRVDVCQRGAEAVPHWHPSGSVSAHRGGAGRTDGLPEGIYSGLLTS